MGVGNAILVSSTWHTVITGGVVPNITGNTTSMLAKIDNEAVIYPPLTTPLVGVRVGASLPPERAGLEEEAQ
jgi:hypothetical protein